VQHRLDHLLDALVVKKFPLQTLTVRENGISPFVDWLVSVEMIRDHDLRDPGLLPKLVAGKDGGFGQEMVRATNGSAVVKIVAAVRKEPALYDVMRVLGRGSTSHAAMLVAREDAVPEIVS
jgi:hypothetical protein